jgi:hypothetical protein
VALVKAAIALPRDMVPVQGLHGTIEEDRCLSASPGEKAYSAEVVAEASIAQADPHHRLLLLPSRSVRFMLLHHAPEPTGYSSGYS